MKEILLTKGYSTFVDDEDYLELSKVKWQVIDTGVNVYAARSITLENKKRTTLKMHRQIMCVSDSKIHINHIDGNSLNNCKNNLRVCTNQENCLNTKGRDHYNTKMIGVICNRTRKQRKKWTGKIKVNGKIYRFEYFATELEAAIARDQFIIDNNLAFPRLNILKRPQSQGG